MIDSPSCAFTLGGEDPGRLPCTDHKPARSWSPASVAARNDLKAALRVWKISYTGTRCLTISLDRVPPRLYRQPGIWMRVRGDRGHKGERIAIMGQPQPHSAPQLRAAVPNAEGLTLTRHSSGQGPPRSGAIKSRVQIASPRWGTTAAAHSILMSATYQSQLLWTLTTVTKRTSMVT